MKYFLVPIKILLTYGIIDTNCESCDIGLHIVLNFIFSVNDANHPFSPMPNIKT
jgi:hypothetical protein